MILRPSSPTARGHDESSGPAARIWDVIFASQQRAPEFFVTQADHAHLAGQIAQSITAEMFPRFDDEIIHAIWLHDEGWCELDRAQQRSFITISPAEFLTAWRGSIATAENSSALGGAIVSAHFERLAHVRLQMAKDAGEDKLAMENFIAGESDRRRRLVRDLSVARLEELTDVLQFCDVFSLYLCCGASERVQFPQSFGDRRFTLTLRDAQYVSDPPLFSREIRLRVPAWAVRREKRKLQPVAFDFQLR